MACLDELQKQQITDQHMYDQKLMEDTMRKLHGRDFKKYRDGDTMIDKRTGEMLDPEADSTHWKGKF